MSGSGTAGDPYLLVNCSELQNMSADVSASYALANDIACSGVAFVPVGNDTSRFTGTFDGQGHEITGLNVSIAADYVGLFGYAENATMHDVAIQGLSVSGNSYAGGLAGCARSTNISNVNATGQVSNLSSSSWLGGVVGYLLYSSDLTASSFAGNVICGGDCGGIVGYLDTSSITNSSATCDVNCFGDHCGGLVGLGTGNITGSHATGNITGHEDVGGLVGRLYILINNSYATGNVTGNDRVGGLVGTAYAGTTNNSYATGNVNCFGDHCGGLAGNMGSGTVIILNSYAIGNVSTNSTGYTGGLVGRIDGGNIKTINNSFAAGIVSGPNAGGLIGLNTSVLRVANSYWDVCRSGRSNCTAAGNITNCTGINDACSGYFYSTFNAPLSSWNFTDIWRAHAGSYPTFGPLASPQYVPNCSVISEPGNYYLTKNLSGSPNTLGPFIDACMAIINTYDVMLDCGGHNLNGTGATDSTGVYLASSRNVTLRNCNVSGYYLGVEADDVNDTVVSNVTIDNAALYGLYGFHFVNSLRSNLTGNAVHGDDVTYAFYFDSSSNANFTGNYVNTSAGEPFRFQLSNYFNAVNNSIYANQYAGFIIYYTNFSSFTDNKAFNCTAGFAVSNSNGLNFTGNTVWGSAVPLYSPTSTGFDLMDSTNLSLTSNNISVNKSVYIYSAEVSLDHNLLYGASAFGIQAQDATVRLSGDRFYNNTQDAEFSSSGPAYPVNMSNVIFDNPSGNLSMFTNLSLNDTIEPGTVYAIAWSANASALLPGYSSFAQKFISIANSTPNVSIDALVWSWTDAEVSAGGYNETKFGLWKFNGTWNALNTTPDTSANTLSLSGLASFSGFGILQFNDTTAPNVTLSAPTNNSIFNFSTVLFNFTALDDLSAVLNCSLYVDGALNMTNSSTQNGTLTTFASGVGDGNHSWFVNCSDSEGNSNVSETRNVSVDTIAPAIAFIPYTDASGIVVPRDWFALHVQATDANLDNMTYWIYNSTGLVFNLTGYGSALVDATHNYTSAPSGMYFFNATAYDRLGHFNSTETRNVTLDMSVPSVALDSPADNQSFNATTVLFNFTATDDLSPVLNCSLYIDGSLDQTNSSTQNGTLTTFSVAGMAEGSHPWYVRCTDGSGNNGTSATRNVIVDLTPPVVTLNSPADNATSTSSTVTFSFTAVDNLSATMACTLYLDAVAAQTSAGVANDTATAFIASGIANGQHNWSVACADNATNTGYSETRNFTVAVREQPHDGHNPEEPQPVLGISITPVCNGYVVTVTSEGARVPNAMVSVSGGQTAYTDGSGQAAFTGCGIDVTVHAARSGAEGSYSAFVQCVPCGCTLDSECAGNEFCSSGTCVPVECGCGLVENHACQPYACCADADCGQGEVCESHQCVPAGCLSDSDCTDSQRCEKAAGAARGHCAEVTGECGQVQNHAWVKYECGAEAGCDRCPTGSNCTGHVCVPQLGIHAPDTGFVGTGVNVTITEGTGRCRNCEVSWTSPSGKAGVGRTDANGNLLIPLNEKGQYKVVIVRDPAKAAFVTSLPKPVQPGEGQPAGILDALAPYFLWLLVLLLVIIGVVLYQRRRATGTRSKPAK